MVRKVLYFGLLLALLSAAGGACCAYGDEPIIDVRELPPSQAPDVSQPPGPPPPGKVWVHRPRPKFHRKIYVSPSLGVSSIHYTEGSTVSYSAISLTGKLSLRYPLNPRWDLGGSMYLTLLPLRQTPSDNSARFLGVNARIGYAPAIIPRPWRLSLLTGLYYVRMIVSNNAFGFTDMVGPQIFPVLARSFKGGDAGMIYFKFSPVAGQLSLLSFSNREIAGGLTYARLIAGGRALTFSLDYSNLSLDFVNIKATATTLSLSAGLNL